MAADLVVVLRHGDDPVAAGAVADLGSLAAAGVVQPFWSVDVGEVDDLQIMATRWTAGPEHVLLTASLAAQRDPGTLRLVTLATDALTDDGLGELQRAVSTLVRTLRRLQPPGARLVDARVIAPSHLESPSTLTTLFTAEADTNLVVIPEDRTGDTAFAIATGLHDTAGYAAHLAVEVATQAGLWTGMAEAPLDRGEPGVVDNGDAKVVLARSYARLVVGPPLPLAEALLTQPGLPVPPRADASPSPHVAARMFADHVFDGLSELHVAPVESFTERREALTLRQSVGRLAREAVSYLAGIPRQLRHGALGDLETVAGEALTSALGDDSTIEVVWSGKTADDGEGRGLPVDPEALRRAVYERLSRPGNPSFDQQQWAGLVGDALSLVDAGPTNPGTQSLYVGNRRVALVDPRAVGPDPTLGLTGVLEGIATEPMDAPAPTLLGRFSARLRHEIAVGERRLAALVASIEEDTRRLAAQDAGVLSLLGAVMAVLFTALVVDVLVLGGVAEWAGVAGWSRSTRLAAGFVLGAVAVGAAVVALLGGLRGRPRLRPAGVVVGLTLVLGGALGMAWWERQVDLGAPLGTVGLGETVLVITVVAVLLEVLLFCAAEPTRRAGAASRITFAVLLGYLALSVVGGVVRGDGEGWYATLDPATRHRWFVAVTVALAIGMLLDLVAIAAARVRERVSIQQTGARLRWNDAATRRTAEEVRRLRVALRQFHGTALALDRLVWWPFGRPTPPSLAADRLEVPAIPALKLQVLHHQPTEQGRRAIVARIRREVAAPGWLQRQYALAVDAFAAQQSLGEGSDPGTAATRPRPECDGAVEVPSADPASTGTGLRWTFAAALYRGDLDHDLRAAGSRSALGGVLEPYFRRADPSVGPAPSEVSRFAEGIVAGRRPIVPARLFEKMSLPVSGDARTRYATDVWWPTEALPVPAAAEADRTELHDVPIAHDGPCGLVVPIVRADASQTFPLHRLPFATGSVPADRKVTPAPDDAELL